ncbi:MAG: hypothetical protein IJI47_04240 [Eubacterium sp.]|nr:hypothetical protein [Eubacterium sp.]
MKRTVCILLCLLITVSFFGCGKGKEINLRDKLASLSATDEALGLKGKYEKFADIKDGSVDSDLVGTWVTLDGDMTYVYSEDGTSKVESKLYGNSESKFVCLNINEYKVVCEEVQMQSEDADGKSTESTVISYLTYNVDNDALYITPVEDTTDENINSSNNTLVVLYRADESGNADKSIAKNKIALDSYAGTWTSDKGKITIADGKLTVGKDEYSISIDDKNRLVVEKDGKSTAYTTAVGVMKEYESDDRSKVTETNALSISYTGADKDDKPNLISVLEDWKTEYQWDSYYYSGSFNLEK